MDSPTSRSSFLVRPSFFVLTHGGCSLVAAAILAVYAAFCPDDIKDTTFIFTVSLCYVLYAIGAFLLAWMRRRSPSMPAFTTTLYSLPVAFVALACLLISFTVLARSFSEGCEVPHPILAMVREPFFWFLLANVLPGLATLARLLRAFFLFLRRP